ncbi:MAG: ATP-binding cassette domain-containing protein [Thiovulaceae bacterium]|nr:ATP-binding cassette domain-containing protein [Sulfurimonadaceae bacterium]
MADFYPVDALHVSGVSVGYKDKIAISDVSFEAKSGEIIGFIGADGAGKSSLMQAIAGIVRFSGEISYLQHKYHSPKEAEKIKIHTGFMPQGIGLVLYDTLTVDEHLRFFADLRDLKKDAAFLAYKKQLLHMSGLSAFAERQAMNLSGGMMQKLSLICALLHRPKLLILDEPTTGVDPLSRLELWEILRNIAKEEGTIILVSTAYMQEASKMDRVMLFHNSKVIASGTSAELIDSIRPYVYEKSLADNDENSISFDKVIYSLDSLNLSLHEPTLEGLFFVNALKERKKIANFAIKSREDDEVIPEVVMECHGVSKKFGAFVANEKIDMQLKKGEILGLLGANGAGKTTFIKMLLGLYSIDEGKLTLLGQSIKSGKDRQELKSKIGYVSQHFALYKDMSVKENLLYFASMHRIEKKTALSRIALYAKELGFEEYLGSFANELPLGVNQRFSIAAALLHEPLVLFLDEPTSGVDTLARAQFWQILQKLKEVWGISILITTHYMSEAQFCDRVVLLKNGQKVADDTVSNLYERFPKAKDFEDIFLEFYKEKA